MTFFLPDIFISPCGCPLKGLMLAEQMGCKAGGRVSQGHSFQDGGHVGLHGVTLLRHRYLV